MANEQAENAELRELKKFVEEIAGQYDPRHKDEALELLHSVLLSEKFMCPYPFI